jgi:hypothetical protein
VAAPAAVSPTLLGASSDRLDAAAGPGTSTPRDASAPPWPPARVLHVGDSMVPLVGNYLRPAFEALGSRYVVDFTDSSTLGAWARDERLSKAVWKHDPDLVLLSLGSNELFAHDLESRAGLVRRLVADLRGRDCVFVGPPAWTDARRFLQMLRDNVAPCRYFDSARLPLERTSDGRHPDWNAGYAWSSEVWAFLGGPGRLPFTPRPDR